MYLKLLFLYLFLLVDWSPFVTIRVKCWNFAYKISTYDICTRYVFLSFHTPSQHRRTLLCYSWIALRLGRHVTHRITCIFHSSRFYEKIEWRLLGLCNIHTDVYWTVHHCDNWRIIKPTRCHLLFYCISYTLNMFRALLCPSSGARYYDVDYHIGRALACSPDSTPA